MIGCIYDRMYRMLYTPLLLGGENESSKVWLVGLDSGLPGALLFCSMPLLRTHKNSTIWTAMFQIGLAVYGNGRR